MVTYYQVRDILEVALQVHGPDARALAGAIAELVPPEHRITTYDYVLDALRPLMWPPPRCACELAALAWRALPVGVR